MHITRYVTFIMYEIYEGSEGLRKRSPDVLQSRLVKFSKCFLINLWHPGAKWWTKAKWLLTWLWICRVFFFWLMVRWCLLCRLSVFGHRVRSAWQSAGLPTEEQGSRDGSGVRHRSQHRLHPLLPAASALRCRCGPGNGLPESETGETLISLFKPQTAYL